MRRREVGEKKARPVERLYDPSQICTPIFCFLETTHYWSADLLPPPQHLCPSPLLSPHPTLHIPLRPR